jgi:peptide chain release factor 1
MYEDIKIKFNQLEEKLQTNALGREEIAKISKEHADLKEIFEKISRLDSLRILRAQNLELINEGADQQLAELAQEELGDLERQIELLQKEIEFELRPKDPRDKKDVIMEIRAGTGGDESALFAADLFRMYSRFAENKKWKIEILNSNRIGLGGFKEIVFAVKGRDVYSFLKYESGTHRVQRVPETEKAGRIHTSAATVAVLPEADEADVEIKAQDLKIDTYCASGPGGQCVNTTYSAVRITHLPTNTVVTCQDQRSQQQNREKALQILRSRILAKIEDDKKQKESIERKNQIGSGDRSEKIRTYNFPQDRVTDHRIKQNWHALDRIMDGEINMIIEALRNEEDKINSSA